MKTFTVTVIRTDEYIISLDENVNNKEALAAWSEVFYDVDSLEDFAKSLAFQIMRFGSDGAPYEGFGAPLFFNEEGSPIRTIGVDPDDIDKSISVTLISEDEDFEYSIKEVI